MRGRREKQKKTVDKKLLAVVLFLVVAGLIAVADASAPQALNYFNDKLYFAKQQFIWAVFGLALLVVISNIHYSFWSKFATVFFIANIALLIAVLIPGIGQTALGARRWLILGPISVQPSELIKLTLAIYLAKLGSTRHADFFFFAPLAAVLGLIMLQPDLGTSIVVSAIGISQIFVSGINIFYLLSALFAGGLGTFLLIIFSPYRRDRLTTFLQTTTDPLGKGYHIRQVLLALGSGGLFGVGLGQSRQKYLFLPEAATDSIFAVIAEELGFVGAMVLLGVFIYLIFRVLKIANSAPDAFSRILSIGLISWIGGQTILNIGSMVALVPLTGIPLPFISYGGSALLTTLIATGILLNISKYVKS